MAEHGRGALAVIADADLHAEHESHRELRRSEARLRALLDHSAEATALTDRTGKLVYMGGSVERLLGRPASDFIGGESFPWILEDDLPAAHAIRRALASEPRKTVTGELRARRADGELRRFEVVARNLLDDPEIEAIVTNFRDVTDQRRVEDELRSALATADLAKRHLEATLAALPVGVWIAEPSGKLVQRDPAAAAIWGGDAPLSAGVSEYAEYVGYWPGTGEPLAPDDWALARTLATGETIVAEAIDIQRFDGTRGHALNSTATIRDERGEIIGGVVVMLDVTERHEAERERNRLVSTLAFERARLGQLLQAAPAFMAVVRGPSHVFELANEAFYELVGRRDLVRRTVAAALAEIVEQGFLEILDGVLASGEPFSARGMPVVLARRPGEAPELRFVNLLLQPLVEADGTRSGVFVHGVDITEEALSRGRIDALFRALPIPTYAWQREDRDGAVEYRVTEANGAGVALAGAGVIGQSARTVFGLDAPIDADLERCLTARDIFSNEISATVAGVRRRLRLTYAPVPPSLIITHIDDVTEKHRLEEQLRQAQKMEAVGRLAGGVAHDFNNLLSVILSYTEQHLEDLNPNDPLREDLQEIHKAGLRAVSVTRQLLAFSRKQVLQPRLLDLTTALEQTSGMLRRLIGEDVELSFAIAADVAPVFADPGQIDQVVMNLVVNARDAMPTGGALTIEAANVHLADPSTTRLELERGDYVMLAITDTGTGMDAATSARVFEPFFTTKAEGRGTGLGLATVFGIVRQSGGDIVLESVPGVGTTFRIYLPRATRARETTGPVRDLRVLTGGSETILLVEDDDAVRTLARTVLRRAGYRVLDAANGGEALMICEQHDGPIHLALTDVVMPRMSGRVLLERLMPLRPSMKVMYMSGYTDDKMVHHGVQDGVPFVHKPLTIDGLLRAVRTVLDDAALGTPDPLH